MLILSLDLEMNQPSGNIIQIGACVGDTNTEEIMETFSVFINNEETLSDYIINLTGITQEQVDSGVSLKDGYEKLKALHTKYICFMNPLTWGGNDAMILKQQLNLPEESFCFGRRCVDIKTIWVFDSLMRSQSPQGGLARVISKMGGKFFGKKHNAMDDAIQTFKLAMIMKNKVNLIPTKLFNNKIKKC